MNSVCDDCKHSGVEEITDGLVVRCCDEEMESFGSLEGCWRFEQIDWFKEVEP